MAADEHACIYCNLTFKDRRKLKAHCRTQTHESTVMSDQGRYWAYRAPPRGLKSDAYVLCEDWDEESPESCKFGIQCVRAHGNGELAEWKERFHYREMKFQRAKDKKLLGSSYTDDLLEKLHQSPNPSIIMQDRIDEVIDECAVPLSVTVSSKNSTYNWNFKLKTYKPLKAVALLQDSYRMHFCISSIYMNDIKVNLQNNQEWIRNSSHEESMVEYRVTVTFKANVFGTFRQSVVFDFSTEPILVKHLCVDLVPKGELKGINEIREGIISSIAERWTPENCVVEYFPSDSRRPSTSEEWEKKLKSKYPCPQPDFYLTHATIKDTKFTNVNYRGRMHELLFMEEIARYDLISRYNFTTKMRVIRNYILAPNGMSSSTAKYSINDEIFGRIELGRDLSEDSAEGRLTLMHCDTVFLKAFDKKDNPLTNKIFEALVEDKGKDTIYLRLSSSTVKELELKDNMDIKVKIQFQLNRLPYCEWHYILDTIRDYKIIFPDTFLEPDIPWSPSKQWPKHLDLRLNVKQREAVIAITTSLEILLPPILVIGPFGTGKTFTLAQAVRILVKEPSNRILLCTHSNSAADLYIKEYFHTWFTEGEQQTRPLRIYYEKRWVNTVNPIVQKYCLIDEKSSHRAFRYPTLHDLEKHQIIVVTLSTSVYLSAINVPQDFFTHILIDEAAQALECETITPLALANSKTRIVLAGDHIQIGPDVFSPFAKERNLHVSLLERLHDHYPKKFPCKILLCENYRSHKSIIQFASESFYDQKLVASSEQPRHVNYFPLSFFTSRGEDVQDKNSTAFYNNSEVYEVVEIIAELKKKWPGAWGKFTDQSIGVVTPYADQVFRIRSEIRKKRIDNVSVERVLNVQGKQFRVIILSTVRTRKTCTSDESEEVDYGFLSNAKLLNTAITRAQSLVAVIGDPVALCSVGACGKIWERFIEICKENNSLFGITSTELKYQLDSIELKKIYTLNPLAPEFYPRSYLMQCYHAFHHGAVLPHHLGLIANTFPQKTGIIHNHPVPVINSQTPLPAASAEQCSAERSFNNRTDISLPPHHSSHQRSCTNSPGNNLIQFMNNVHFPEAPALSDCINLLPHNMSLSEMLLQPQAMQERWYIFLKESSGLDAAEKFKYLLKTTNQKGTKLADESIFEFPVPQSTSSQPTYWYDNPSNHINLNKSVYTQNDHSVNLNTAHAPDNSADTSKVEAEMPSSIVNSVLELDEVNLEKQLNEEIANLRIQTNEESRNEQSLSTESKSKQSKLTKFYQPFQ